jgi:hypothetical protein
MSDIASQIASLESKLSQLKLAASGLTGSTGPSSSLPPKRIRSPPLSDEERLARTRESSRKYYYDHRARILAKSREKRAASRLKQDDDTLSHFKLNL